MTELVKLRPPQRRRPIATALFCVFLLPVLARAALLGFDDRPMSWRSADWSSIGSLPSAHDYPQARILVMTGRTGGLKGAVALHSWIVIKRENAPRWSRFDKVGWGMPVRLNGWAPDGRWYGDRPTVIADIAGERAAALIPRIEAAIAEYAYAKAGDYRMWPGPNSNTFVAAVLRAVPEIGVALPPNAIGRDFRPLPYIGLTDSGTGVEISAFGVFGIKVGWVEGIEINVLSLVAGVDLRRPGLKIPGFGRIGLDVAGAIADSPR